MSEYLARYVASSLLSQVIGLQSPNLYWKSLFKYNFLFHFQLLQYLVFQKVLMVTESMTGDTTVCTVGNQMQKYPDIC